MAIGIVLLWQKKQKAHHIMNYPGGPFSFVSDHRQQSIKAENEKKMRAKKKLTSEKEDHLIEISSSKRFRMQIQHQVNDHRK